MEPGNYGRFINMEPGLFLPITEAGSKDSTFWDDPVAVKYKSQIETMLDNSTRGSLFGFTNGNTFTSISSISAQNLLSQTLQLAIIDGKDAKSAVEGQSIMNEVIGQQFLKHLKYIKVLYNMFLIKMKVGFCSAFVIWLSLSILFCTSL